MIKISSARKPSGSGSAPALSTDAKKISSAIAKGVPGIVDATLRKSLKAPSIVESKLSPQNDQARGKVVLTYTLPDAKTAKAIATGFGPVDDENLLTDNLNAPSFMDTIAAHAKGNLMTITATWTAPRSPKMAAVEGAFGLMPNLIMDSAKNDLTAKKTVSVIEPSVKTTGNDTHGTMTITYPIMDQAAGAYLAPADAAHLAGGIQMDKASLATANIKLPSFVTSVTATGVGDAIAVKASW